MATFHPNKDVNAALRDAIALGWRYEKKDRKRSGHAVGRLKCPYAARGGCQMSVNGTPANPYAHADQIRAFVSSCPHV